MKKMWNTFIYVGVAFGLCVAARVQAQETAKDSLLNRTVVVENEYNPDIMDATKIGVLPRVPELPVTKKNIEYLLEGKPLTGYSYRDVLLPMAIPSQEGKIYPGYASAGYGNYGNLDARLGYLFSFGKQNRLGVSLHTDGHNGTFRRTPEEAPDEAIKWRSKFYRFAARANYEHGFERMMLRAGARFGTDRFTYQPTWQSGVFQRGWEAAPHRQQMIHGDVYAGICSTDKDLPVQFSGETGYRVFRRQYVSPATDHTLYIKAGASAFINDLFYLNLGARADFGFGFTKAAALSAQMEGKLTVAPGYVLYAQVEGGSRLLDLCYLFGENPYVLSGHPLSSQTSLPLSGTLGFKSSPMPGFWFHLFGGYRMVKDDLCYLPRQLLSFPAVTLEDTRAAFAGVGVKYDYKDLFRLSVEGEWNRWHADKEAVLLFKPEARICATTEVRIIDPLSLTAGYEYEVRKRTEDLNNLSLGVSYRFWNEFSVYGKLDNLLNKEYSYYYGYPSEKLNFRVGLSVRF